jgi:signal transduction histidine kinase
VDACLPGGEELFDAAACGLVLTDARGMIVRANANARAWLGYGALDAIEARMIDLLPVGARLFYHTHCQPILQVQGSVAEIQVEVRNRKQERLPMLINIVRKGTGPGVLDHWALFKASDRRAYERELLAARKLSEAALEARRDAEAELQRLNDRLSAADRKKDEFLATLSHELRNPLAPMRSALDVLNLKFGGRGDDRLLQVFDRQLRHMTRLVDDLMEVSRITQGCMQLQRAPVELAALVRSAAHDMTATMRAARHTLQVSVADLPLVVDGDATRLSQVIANLLTNAAKYTPDGGTISLSLECEPDGDGGNHAVIRVRDDGIGIPASALATVFDMFAQLQPALERAKGGLGIGLALVRGIVELHGGSIHAASPGTGMGSEFTVRLPLAAVHAPAAAAPECGAMPAGARVLVVDDNRDAAEMLTAMLELSGCETRMVHTAAEALELARAFFPTVALLDIGLPDMNGYELARRLRSNEASERMLLIATTGWGQDKDRLSAFDAGFDHHLTKPIDFGLLSTILAPDTSPGPRR